MVHFKNDNSITMDNLKKILLILVIGIMILPITSETKEQKSKKEITNEERIGTIIINKISLKEDLYKIESPENNIEKHVTILKESVFPNHNNSIIFLAAHSGTGKIAYFEKLNQLKTNDEVILLLKKKEYKYIVKDIWEEPKNGYINVNKENLNQLILTTCSPTNRNKQLIINCIEKESN